MVYTLKSNFILIFFLFLFVIYQVRNIHTFIHSLWITLNPVDNFMCMRCVCELVVVYIRHRRIWGQHLLVSRTRPTQQPRVFPIFATAPRTQKMRGTRRPQKIRGTRHKKYPNPIAHLRARDYQPVSSGNGAVRSSARVGRLLP